MDVQSLIILHLLIPTDYGKIEMLHIQIYLGGMHTYIKSCNMQNPNLIGTEVPKRKTTAARELTQGPLKQMDGIALNGPGLL